MSSSWAARTNLSRVAIGVIILDPSAELNSIQYRFEPKFNLKVSELSIPCAAIDRRPGSDLRR
jgi:hypothetical protein